MQLVLQVCSGGVIFQKSAWEGSKRRGESVTVGFELRFFHRFRRGGDTMLKTFAILMSACGLLAAAGLPAVADDNGLAGSIHDLRREGRKLCQVDHWHYGSGVGSTKKAAMADAVGSWQSFTALEYGTDWARFQKANSRNVSCSNTGGGGVSCSIEGRPCR
jgi:hypothetical protein